MPALSVIMPCFNTSLYIAEAIRSVLSQTFQDWELIIVDDGSTDDTYGIACKFAREDARIKVYKQENKGVAAARNFGYSKSSDTKYLFFFDSDDIILPAFLERLLGKFHSTDTNIGIVYSDFSEIDEAGRPIKNNFLFHRLVPTNFWLRSLSDEVEETPFISIFCGSNMNESTCIFDKNLFRILGGWNESLKYAEGIELFLKASLFRKVIFVPEKLFKYRRHQKQTQSLMLGALKESYFKWAQLLVGDFCLSDSTYRGKFKTAELFYSTRVRIKYLIGSSKHAFRYQPLQFLKIIYLIPVLYTKSILLLLYRRYWL